MGALDLLQALGKFIGYGVIGMFAFMLAASILEIFLAGIATRPRR